MAGRFAWQSRRAIGMWQSVEEREQELSRTITDAIVSGAGQLSAAVSPFELLTLPGFSMVLLAWCVASPRHCVCCDVPAAIPITVIVVPHVTAPFAVAERAAWPRASRRHSASSFHSPRRSALLNLSAVEQRRPPPSLWSRSLCCGSRTFPST